MKVGSLFSGIGGFDLGFERAGMRSEWFCEQDTFCQQVLARHWPEVPCYDNIYNLKGTNVSSVDVVCGGFPCPVVSQAARGRNTGPWLWPEFARIIREVGPRFVVVENVEALLTAGRGFGEVLADLAESGFDAAWRVLRASDFGAPHHRSRVWLVAYTNEGGKSDFTLDAETPRLSELYGEVWRHDPPGSLGMDDGIPAQMDRNRALGNALVPQIAEWIGRQIMEYG